MKLIILRYWQTGLRLLVLSLLISCKNQTPQVFYVDSSRGSDKFSGNMEMPFGTIDKALEVIKDRIENGIFSDTVYIRAGTYRKKSDITCYELHLQGRANAYSLFSAMPCDSTTPGAVRRKSGRWYEKVIIDDAWIVRTPWEKVVANGRIWKTDPGYTHLQWKHQNLWPWTLHGFPLTRSDETPETTEFTVAPYMLLQDGIPSIWVNSYEELTDPGNHFYDHQKKILFFIPLNQIDPNNSKIETWYGGDESYETGTLYLDGEGRGLFDGNLQYAAIKGIEFRMFNKLFEFHRRGYRSESERIIQRDVLFEDNECRYGWIQILLDANTVLDSMPGVIRPRYGDRARWIVRNNLFYRPSREVCQLHGDDHLFERNVIIDHLGPWAGPAACVSAVNTRNTLNFTARNNYFVGQGNNPYHSGSVFMIESGKEHANKEGDHIRGGQTYENNLIANVTSGAAFVLGKGGARLKDITIRNNIVKTNRNSPAVLIGSPHKNLRIMGNIFYDQKMVIEINSPIPEFNFESLPSEIEVFNNIFVNNRSLFDKRFIQPSSSSVIVLRDNLLDSNLDVETGNNLMGVEIRFNDPENFDFTFSEEINTASYDAYAGPSKCPWYLYRKIYPKELEIPEENMNK